MPNPFALLGSGDDEEFNGPEAIPKVAPAKAEPKKEAAPTKAAAGAAKAAAPAKAAPVKETAAPKKESSAPRSKPLGDNNRPARTADHSAVVASNEGTNEDSSYDPKHSRPAHSSRAGRPDHATSRFRQGAEGERHSAGSNFSRQKRDGAGAGNWGKKVDDALPEVAATEPATPAVEGEAAAEATPAEVPAAEQDNTISLDQYLATKTSASKPVHKIRQANEGANTAQWKDTVKFTREADEETHRETSAKKTQRSQQKVAVEVDFNAAAPSRGGFEGGRGGGFEGRGRGRGGRGGFEGRGRGGDGGRGRGSRSGGEQRPVNFLDEKDFPSLK